MENIDLDAKDYRPFTFKKSTTPKMSRFGNNNPVGIAPSHESIDVEEMQLGDLKKKTGVPKEQSEIIVENDDDSEEF